MIRTIHLHGALSERFGSKFELDVESPGEAIHALAAQLRGFERAIRDGEWICIRGRERGDDSAYCDEQLLKLRFGKVREFHIMPAASGRGRGLGKILMGILLIGATIFTAGGALAGLGLTFGQGVSIFGLSGALAFGLGGAGLFAAGFGALLVLGGVAQLLSPTPKVNNTDEKPGYLFNGAVNTYTDGTTCPIVVGRIRAGSVIVSAGIISERTSSSVPHPTGVTEIIREGIAWWVTGGTSGAPWNS